MNYINEITALILLLWTILAIHLTVFANKTLEPKKVIKSSTCSSTRCRCVKPC